jgi:hypothetical protein
MSPVNKQPNMQHAPIQQMLTSTPPVAVAGMTVLGYPLADWVQVLALVWLGLQIGWFIYSKFKQHRAGK